jgi:hypothetical protein
MHCLFSGIHADNPIYKLIYQRKKTEMRVQAGTSEIVRLN